MHLEVGAGVGPHLRNDSLLQYRIHIFSRLQYSATKECILQHRILLSCPQDSNVYGTKHRLQQTALLHPELNCPHCTVNRLFEASAQQGLSSWVDEQHKLEVYRQRPLTVADGCQVAILVLQVPIHNGRQSPQV